MSQHMEWWLALSAAAAVTFALRLAPLLLPKSWLKSPLLADLNAALPLCVLLLLALGSLSIGKLNAQEWPYLAAQLLALFCVLLAHIRWRNILISLATGVGALNGFLWLFGQS